MPAICEQCGAPLRGDVARGLCPRCVLGATLASESDVDIREPASQRFGDYELVRELGRGGMGVVYEARQLSLNRTVALKMLLPARLASRQELERFQFEAEGVAALDHPNILPVFEVGSVQGQPYFTMKLAEGGALSERMANDKWQMPNREAARLVATIARAVHYAHQRGIQHRDLKPGNILLDRDGRPFVSDFGLAKFRDKDSGLTLSTTVLGSPAYMSPEQATGDAKHVTVASDVYSLGAILYELLARRPPFQAPTALETMRQVVEQEPASLRSLDARIDRDLDVICLKCLSKEPAKRYASAEALADELERWLTGEPILARPISSPERLARWCRRKPALAGALAALLLALIAGVTGVAVQWRRAQEHSRRAEEHSRQRALERYAADMQVASQALASHDLGLARRMIAAQTPEKGEPDPRGFEWRLLARLCEGRELRKFTGHGGTVTCVAFSPDGRVAVSGAMDNSVRLWDVETGALIRRISSHGVPWSVAFTPDGERIITAGMDGKVRFWTRDGERVGESLAGQTFALSADGARLAVSESSPFKYFGTKPGVRVWDWRANKLLFETNVAVRRVALSADGQWLAGAGAPRDVWLWNVTTREARRLRTADTLWALAFSPDGTRLAGAGFNVGAKIWDLNSTNAPVTLSGHQFKTWGISFSPDGTRVVTTGSDRTLQIRSLEALDRATVLEGHDDEVWWAAWSRDGRRLMTAGKDMTLRLWPAEAHAEDLEVAHTKEYAAMFSDDGTRLLTIEARRTPPRVCLRDAHTGKELMCVEHRFAAAFAPRAHDVLVLNDGEGRLERWSAGTQALAAATALANFPSEKVMNFAFAPDVTALATVTKSGTRVWRVSDGALIAGPLPLGGSGPQVALSPGGRHLAVGFAAPYHVHLHDLVLPRRFVLTNHTEEVKGLAFSPDGALLASASVDRFVRLWSTADGSPRAELVRHVEEATGVAFSPDGKTLASIGTEQAVKLWHLPTLREVVSISVPDAGARVTFSPAGDALAFTTVSNTVRVIHTKLEQRR